MSTVQKPKLLIITQIIDPNDYVFGFFYGHILDLAAACESVQILCLEHRGGVFPENVTVHSLGKERGVHKFHYLRQFYHFLFTSSQSYDTVLIHMEPLYLLMGGFWWRLMGKQVVLWYNHVYSDWKLRLGSWFAHQIIGVSKQTIPVPHPNIQLVSYQEDLSDILTKPRS